ncbi:hypothetical protein [Olleya sp. HaHaR_3_96]|uniref:hypothetical protein n=1 Tax=Olleya sp. HaHaR_3_96 TaxID=2745560 RepID=UPI001C4FB8AD|nr:hypothetical protein [Olleya sp. HaHaR_3_96]QXP59000.1 hypothetical protein H0I26_13890 [Olleya sp. HaHaR_3_96]
MRARIKYLLLISIPFYGITSVYLFFEENHSTLTLFIGLFIFSILGYLIIPSKKIKVDKNNNAIKKQK